jgi:enoyl-CoA hydratase/carnithine racemase
MGTIRISHDDTVGATALDNFAKRHALGVTTVGEMLETETYDLARRVRSRSGEAIRAYKLQAAAMVRAAALSAQDSQWINPLCHDVYAGPDYAEGIAAFKEKRPPSFD